MRRLTDFKWCFDIIIQLVSDNNGTFLPVSTFLTVLFLGVCTVVHVWPARPGGLERSLCDTLHGPQCNKGSSRSASLWEDFSFSLIRPDSFLTQPNTIRYPLHSPGFILSKIWEFNLLTGYSVTDPTTSWDHWKYYTSPLQSLRNYFLKMNEIISWFNKLLFQPSKRPVDGLTVWLVWVRRSICPYFLCRRNAVNK